MLLRKSVSLESTIRSSDITPQHVFEQHQTNRRRFLAGAGFQMSGVYEPPVAPGRGSPRPPTPGRLG